LLKSDPTFIALLTTADLWVTPIVLSRSMRSLSITDAGELFYQSALDIVEMHSQMLDYLAMLNSNISGEFRITAPALWGEVVLAAIIIAYKQSYPLVNFLLILLTKSLIFLRLIFMLRFAVQFYGMSPI
jgi:DNA-binding transcriptional LysR family regulator